MADLSQVTTCADPILQYSWQDSERVGREEIAQAIAESEDIIASYLGYRVGSAWEVAERHVGTIPYGTAPMSLQQIRADYGMLEAGGIEAKSLIQASANIVYSDSNSDGYKETATIVVATTVTDPEEISIYFPGESGSNEWEIRPIKVVIAGGNATITCRRELLVDPDLQEAFDATGVDGLVDANFITDVDVYRHYHDPQQQIMFIWQNAFTNLCTCGSSNCITCTDSIQYGCMTVVDPRIGIIVGQPATWNTVTSQFDGALFSVARPPDRVDLWYRAGCKDKRLSTPHLMMDPKWEKTVTYLALSKLDRPLCGCRALENNVSHWQEDLAESKSTGSESLSTRISMRKLDNPLGTTRGEIYAWERISREALGEGAYA